MNTRIIIAQVIGFIVLAFNLIVTQQDTKKGMFVFNSIANILCSIQYIVLGAYTGCIGAILGIIRNIMFVRYEGKKIPFYLYLTYAVLLIGFSLPFIDGPVALIPIFNGLLFSYGLWQSDIRKTKIIVILVSLNAMYYNMIKLAFINIVKECLNLFGSLSYLIRTKKENNDSTNLEMA